MILIHCIEDELFCFLLQQMLIWLLTQKELWEEVRCEGRSGEQICCKAVLEEGKWELIVV